MTTARGFLKYASVEGNERNLHLLTRYTESNIDFSQFPDAEVSIMDMDIAELPDEPANFQEYLDSQNVRVKLSFRVDDDKAKALKHKAVDENTTVQALLERAVDEIIREDDEK